MAMALLVATDDRSIEDVQCGRHSRRAVALVIVGHGSGAALLDRQSRLSSVERLDLALLVDRQHDGVRREIDIELDHVALLGDEFRIRELELSVGRGGCR